MYEIAMSEDGWHRDVGVAWRDIPPRPPFDGVRVRVLTAQRSRLDSRWDGDHRLDPYDRLYAVVDGSAMMSFAGIPVPLVPGQVYLIPAHTPHQHRCEREVTMWWTHATLLIDGERGLFERIPGIHVRTVDAGWTKERFQDLCDACADDTPSGNCRRSAALLDLVAPFAALAVDGEERERACFLPVLAAIEAAIGDQDLPVQDMAKLCGLSPGHFIRRFTVLFGTTPARYRQRRRLATAQSLLMASEHSIDAIARRCGFYDGFHLNRVFRRFLDTTPSEYRRRIARVP